MPSFGKEGGPAGPGDSPPLNTSAIYELHHHIKTFQPGCYKTNEGGNHEIWFSPISNKSFLVGRHNTEDVRKGVQNSILIMDKNKDAYEVLAR